MKRVVITGRDALLVTDIQNDFLPGGSLAVPDGDAIIGPVNRYIDRFVRAHRPIIASRDWHPPNHCSFRPQGGPWPVHCVAGTAGAAFHPALKRPNNMEIISKATDSHKDAYSAFLDTALHQRLQSLGVGRLLICGLATEYCVYNTVMDALERHYAVLLALDAIRAIDAHAGDGEQAIQRMLQAGAKPVTLQQITD